MKRWQILTRDCPLCQGKRAVPVTAGMINVIGSRLAARGMAVADGCMTTMENWSCPDCRERFLGSAPADSVALVEGSRAAHGEGGAGEVQAGEDRVAFVDGGEWLLFAVADGAGGMGGGARAAELALERTVGQEFASARECSLHLATLDAELLADREAGETTFVLAVLREERVFGASVGDSRAWLVHGSGRIDLTADQNRKPLLGSGEAVPVAFENRFPWGTMVLATDGLFNYVDPGAIVQALRCDPLEGPGTNLPQVVTSLVERARLPSGELQDDIAILAVRVGLVAFVEHLFDGSGAE